MQGTGVHTALGTFSGLSKCGLKEEKPGGLSLGILCIHPYVPLLICASRMKELLQEKGGEPQALGSPMLFLRRLPLPPCEPDTAPCQDAGWISVPTRLISQWLFLSEQSTPSYMVTLPLCLFEGTLIAPLSLQRKAEVRETLRNPKPQLAPGCLGAEEGS